MELNPNPNPEEINKYFKYYLSIVNAKKKYSKNNRDLISERARDKYNNDTEYKERKLQQMREYAKKRREKEKLKKMEEDKNI